MKVMLRFAAAALMLSAPTFAANKSYSSKSSGYGYTNSSHTHVKSTVTKDGTYRQSHERTNANTTQKDNYGTRGNTNPWTGKKGTKGADY